MAISSTSTRYDAILLGRQRQREAAALRDARSESRQAANQQMLAKSNSLRNTIANVTANGSVSQSQLTSQLIRTRMAADAADKATANKWYR